MNIKDYDPWQSPENPFDYRALIRTTDGIGKIPKEKLGTKIAIIGAGCSGLCAAYELMKIGLHPVVYESAANPDGSCRIGGRVYSYRFPGDPNAIAEIGAMRFPLTSRTLVYYMDQFGIDYSQPFPDPLLVPTTLYIEGEKYFIPVGGPLPPAIQKAADAWKAVVTPLVKKMARAWDNPTLRSQQWQKFVEQYANKSFFEVLNEHGLSRQEIKLFGSLGLGTGGFDSLYQISFIEILRVVTCKWESDQRLIKGGVDQVPMNFWTRARHCVHWEETSVKQLNNGQPLPAVKEIYTPPDPVEKVSITDINGNTQQFDAVLVSCSLRALEMDIKVNRYTFSDEVWAAVQNIHLICAGKVFVRTKTAFWKDQNPASTLNCTITDEATRGTYLFDFDNTPSGVICLSYVWGDSSVKFNGLDHEERVQTCIRTLKKIYGRDLISHQIAESVSFFWEAAKGYNGAFKLTYPGQYEYQQALYLQPFTPSSPFHNGVFLAGDTTSWAGGWIEGALHSGLDAAIAIIHRLGGTAHHEPGAQ
ncbi:MAG: FAD-dependent oxidoreductase [Candidatus Aminicenantes bacterium]|nr:MAG: FAD-dependent oxidoreductase [Candidatus Aminicenantes bacterium]